MKYDSFYTEDWEFFGDVRTLDEAIARIESLTIEIFELIEEFRLAKSANEGKWIQEIQTDIFDIAEMAMALCYDLSSELCHKPCFIQA
jgi:hypothetical protein